MKADGSESSSASHADVNGIHRESKLELFGFDSLVNILGLRRYNQCVFLCYLFKFIFWNEIFLSLYLHYTCKIICLF